MDVFIKKIHLKSVITSKEDSALALTGNTILSTRTPQHLMYDRLRINLLLKTVSTRFPSGYCTSAPSALLSKYNAFIDSLLY